MRRYWTFALAVVALLPAGQSRAADAPRKLNVVFIAVDDLNVSLGCYGHPLVKTPHIDALARRGVRFDRAYCQYPLCNPSRTSLLSGRRPDTTGVVDNNVPPRTRLGDVAFLPEHFAAQGYYTARVGKIAHGAFEGAVRWSEANAAQRPRRRAVARAAGQAQQPERQQAPRQAVGRLNWRAAEGEDADQPDGRTARRIAALIEEHREGPFFIAAGFHKPHLPLVAPQRYFQNYPVAGIPLPKEPADHLQQIPRIALTHQARDAELSDDQRREVIVAYLACVSFMDAQVELGVLVETLDRLKLWDNTVVVLFGDHGWHLGEHGGMWRKMSLFEESARVPLIVVAPGNKAGASSPALVELVDLYPTLCALAGIAPPSGLEGTSFAPLLTELGRAWKKAAFTQVARGGGVMGRSLRTARYRYIEWGDAKQAQLYDHEKDPRELVNLAHDAAHADEVARHSRMLREGWKAATHDAAAW